MAVLWAPDLDLNLSEQGKRTEVTMLIQDTCFPKEHPWSFLHFWNMYICHLGYQLWWPFITSVWCFLRSEHKLRNIDVVVALQPIALETIHGARRKLELNYSTRSRNVHQEPLKHHKTLALEIVSNLRNSIAWPWQDQRWSGNHPSGLMEGLPWFTLCSFRFFHPVHIPTMRRVHPISTGWYRGLKGCWEVNSVCTVSGQTLCGNRCCLLLLFIKSPLDLSWWMHPFLGATKIASGLCRGI